MYIRKLTPDYAVSPQITPTDLPAIAAAGFKTILCNRPDAEVPADLQAESLRAATEAAGLTFVENPVTHGAMTLALIELQSQTIAGPGPVLAYCASGTRSTVVWMLGQAHNVPSNTLISAAAEAGYQLEGLRPQLDSAFRG
ncbi:MAG: hypothetical protein ACJAQW_001030 [Paracoccaceae bacterium]|jgi:uncharacterized protein (TIGR01244 family)